MFEVTEELSLFPRAAQAAIRINTIHHLKSKRVSEELEIVLTSRSSDQMSPAQLESFRRGHWGIENPLHYVRDVSFGEDLSTVRTAHGPQNMAALRNVVIGLCALDGARRGKRALYLPVFRRQAQNDKQVAIDLITRPLLNEG